MKLEPDVAALALSCGVHPLAIQEEYIGGLQRFAASCAALAQQAEPPGSMPQHERLKQMEAQAQAEPTVPSDYADSHQPKACQEEPPICRLCYGIGYDASGQLCACQDTPSLD